MNFIEESKKNSSDSYFKIAPNPLLSIIIQK